MPGFGTWPRQGVCLCLETPPHAFTYREQLLKTFLWACPLKRLATWGIVSLCFAQVTHLGVKLSTNHWLWRPIVKFETYPQYAWFCSAFWVILRFVISVRRTPADIWYPRNIILRSCYHGSRQWLISPRVPSCYIPPNRDIIGRNQSQYGRFQEKCFWNGHPYFWCLTIP